MTVDELKEAARLDGYGDLADIEYAVLETDGKAQLHPGSDKMRDGQNERRALAGPPLLVGSFLEDIDQQGDYQQHADDRPNDSASSQVSLLCVGTHLPPPIRGETKHSSRLRDRDGG